MKALAVFALMLGLYAMYFGLYRSGLNSEFWGAKTQVLAMNFATVRNAALQYVYCNQSDALTMTDIPQTAYAKWLPTGWLPMRAWQVRMDNQICYVFGPAEADEIDAIRKLYRGSFSLGRAERGQLVPNHQADMPVPEFIPNGSIVSMTEVHKS